MSTTPSLRAPLAAALLLALAACGDERPPAGPGPGHLQRLTLVPDAALPETASQVVARHVPLKDSESWTGETQGRAIFTRTPPDDDPQHRAAEHRIPAFAVEGAGPKSISLLGDFDPTGFNAALVHIDAMGAQPEYARLVARRAGRALVSTEWVEVASKPVGPTPIPFELPGLRKLADPFDELRVELKGEVSLTAVTGIDLVLHPVRLFVPGGGSAEALMVLGEEARGGWALSSQAPLSALVEVEERAELSFSYALVEDARMPNQQPELVLELSGKGCEPREERFPLENKLSSKGAWHQHRVALGELAGKSVRARFRLDVRGEHEGFAFVAEPVVRVRGDAPPTVLLITSDTHRADHLGRVSRGLVQTPALDALAERGLVFTNTYASTNVTNPSHAALMTAMTPRDTHIVNNHSPLIDEATTLAERFRAAGYRTFASASAYHLQHDESGLGQGFDRLSAPRRQARWGAKSVDVLEGWLPDAEGEALFVWLHLFDAHSPYAPPAPFDRKYWDKGTDPFDPDAERMFPAAVDPPGALALLKDPDFVKAQYRAGVDYVDSQVGRVLAWPRFGDALVAFTADHGECIGHNGVWFDHAELYPSSVHVPLIIAGAGLAHAEVDLPVRQIDIGRTLLSLSGEDAAVFPGRDLRWTLAQDAATDARFLIAAHRMSAAINHGRWHLIVHLKDHQEWSLEAKKLRHATELYDLEIDPSCSVNLVEREHDRAAALRGRLIAWLEDAPASGLARSVAMTAARMEQLKALGYSPGENVGTLWDDPDCECEFCAPFR
jgi:arylsulfatase A-like enzyme